MPDHAKKLGELAEYFKACSVIGRTTHGDQEYSERMVSISKLLDEMLKVVDAIEDGIKDANCTNESWVMPEMCYSDAEAFLAAVEKLK